MQRFQRALLAIMSALAITVIGSVSTFVSTTASAQTAGKTHDNSFRLADH
ncbi:hypothetical protein ACVWXQ_008035 [Bradyrhizobium sp. S3.14.4]